MVAREVVHALADAALGLEQNVRAVDGRPRQRTREDLFRLAAAVDVGMVVEVDAGLPRGREQIVRFPMAQPGDAHAAQADDRAFQPALADVEFTHDENPFLGWM